MWQITTDEGFEEVQGWSDSSLSYESKKFQGGIRLDALPGWTELRKKPCQIGKCSRGFLIDKDKMLLESNTTYILRIIPEDKIQKKEDDDDAVLY